MTGLLLVYLVGPTAPTERPYYVAATETVASGAGLGLGFVFSALAHIQGVVWPLPVIISLNLIAAGYCLTLPRRERQHSASQ